MIQFAEIDLRPVSYYKIKLSDSKIVGPETELFPECSGIVLEWTALAHPKAGSPQNSVHINQYTKIMMDFTYNIQLRTQL